MVNKSRKVLTESWTSGDTDAVIPMINKDDIYSRETSTYYIEDGSYVRFKVLQIGYTIPVLNQKLGLDRFRIYIQAQNLFTLTSYSGLDPAIPFQQDIDGSEDYDIFTGYDYGFYPASKSFSIGLNMQFK